MGRFGYTRGLVSKAFLIERNIITVNIVIPVS